MRIIIGGDFVPNDAHAQALPDARGYVDVDAFHTADLRIVNLEAPIASRGTKPARSGAALGVRDSSCAALRLLRVDAVSLANNHIFDYGEAAFQDTVRHLEAAGIAHIGAGLTEDEAHRPLCVEGGWGLFAYCHVGSGPVARGRSPGVAGLTVDGVFRDLDAASGVDSAILCVHWGREHTCLPTREVLRLARELRGHPKVRAIVGAHPHRLQGVWRGTPATVAFSLGHLHVPGFVIEPPLVMAGFDPGALPVTRSFHFVTRPTFKEWPLASRVSAVALIDTRTQHVELVPIHQASHGTHVRELFGFTRLLVGAHCRVAGALARFPSGLIDIWHAWHALVTSARLLYWVWRSNGAGALWRRVRSVLPSFGPDPRDGSHT
jgi:hypothetical protein